MDLTHASFFSGVGGLDMGLERAGWRTVSFSEIDPYASAILAERWPGIPNLGDITQLAHGVRGAPGERSGIRPAGESADSGSRQLPPESADATLWTGGFPCQDLSIAGKRAGFAGTRSSLAFVFLDLVERYRPPAIILENVPGLLSSHQGRDFYALQRRMAELGYVGAYRVLDAQHFGVPQRRRRVFIIALNAQRGLGADSAAEVLSVGSRCGRHPATGHEAGPGVAAGTRPGVDIARAVTDTLVPAVAPGARGWRGMRGDGSDPILSSSPDSGGVRAADGLAGRLDDRGGVAATLNSGGNDGGFRTEPGEHLIVGRRHRATSSDDADRWEITETANSVNGWDQRHTGNELAIGQPAADSDLLPLGLDSHRYRCCGNGVVSSVTEWVGYRLAAALL